MEAGAARSRRPFTGQKDEALKEKVTRYVADKTDEELAKERFIPLIAGDMDDLEEAWKYFVLMEATDWKHLPKSGGLEEQDEALMDNIFAITSFVRKVQKANQNNG